MRPERRPRSSVFHEAPWRAAVLLAVLAAVLAACQPGAVPVVRSSPQPLADLRRNVGDTARLSAFLTLRDPDGPGVRLEMVGLAVFTGSVWVPVTVGAVRIDSEQVGPGQVFLGGRAVPPGRYERLRLTFAEGSIRRDSGAYQAVPVEPANVELELPSPLVLGAEDSRSLFLTWDVDGSLTGPDRLRPALGVAPQMRPLPVDLVYAACPDIDTVFVIRTDKNWVADSFGVKGRPTYLVMDPDPVRQRLYALASHEASIKVLDLSSQRVVGVFPLPLMDAPTFFTASPDGRWGYVLEERGGYVSRVELDTGRSAARVRLGHRPRYAVYLPGRELLAVSSGLSQAVSLLHPVDLTEVSRILTGSSPQGLHAANDLLYIAESGDHTVSVYDLLANRVLSRFSVGLGPERVLADRDQVYVSNPGDGSVSVLVPGQLGVVREIHGLGRPLEMALGPRERWIYVGDGQRAGIVVIDATANRLVAHIPLGAAPVGLAVLR